MTRTASSGAKAAHPGLATALEVARNGDVLTVCRLGRSLDERGVGPMSVQENTDTASSSGRLMFHIFGTLAQFGATWCAGGPRPGGASARNPSC